jgi:hypothetical protein
MQRNNRDKYYSRIFITFFFSEGERGGVSRVKMMKCSPPIVGIQRHIIIEAGSLNGIS